MPRPLRLRWVTVPAGLLAAAGCGGGGGEPDAGIEVPGAVWTVPMQYGYEGSPALCDLEGDGALEAIVPLTSFFGDTGPDSYLAIIETETGTVRAESPAGVGGFAYPFCVDVDGDGVRDAILAGRSGRIEALSGADGTPLWELGERNPGLLAGNTYATVAEAGDDSLLFATAGGGGNPELSDPDVPGVLIAYGRDGTAVGSWRPPGGDEIYGAPAVVRQAAELLVAVGTGGERLSGSLQLLAWDDAQSLFAPRWAAPSGCATGGFVASPVFGDLTGDQVPELVGIDFCGRIHAIDLAGATHWTHDAGVSYGTANPLLADLNSDGALDVVAAFESINYSFYEETRADPHSAIVAVDGATGDPLWEQRLDLLVFASPVSADYDGDGVEDVWVAGSAIPIDGLVRELRIYSGVDGAVLHSLPLGNTAGTPILGDFDDDGVLDLLITELQAARRPGVIVRVELDGVSFDPARSFSGFRGHPDHDGAR